MLDTYRIQTLDQVRVLSDPLKLKVIQILTERESTAKEIAEALGQNVTRLYRHVDALYDAGLIEITKETPKRGTVERTFRSVARRFEVDHALFSRGIDSKSTIRDLFRAAEEELVQALDRADDEAPVFMRLRVKGSPEELREFSRRLLEWVESARAMGEVDVENAETAGALIAFYPIRE